MTIVAWDIWILLSLCLTFSCDDKRANPQEQREPLLVTALYKYFPQNHLPEFLQEQGSIQLFFVYYIEN